MSRPKSSLSAAAFKEALRVLGWSQGKAAREFGVSHRRRISDFANGHRPVTRRIAEQIAKILDTHLRRKGL